MQNDAMDMEMELGLGLLDSEDLGLNVDWLPRWYKRQNILWEDEMLEGLRALFIEERWVGDRLWDLEKNLSNMQITKKVQNVSAKSDEWGLSGIGTGINLKIGRAYQFHTINGYYKRYKESKNTFEQDLDFVEVLNKMSSLKVVMTTAGIDYGNKYVLPIKRKQDKIELNSRAELTNPRPVKRLKCEIEIRNPKDDRYAIHSTTQGCINIPMQPFTTNKLRRKTKTKGKNKTKHGLVLDFTGRLSQWTWIWNHSNQPAQENKDETRLSSTQTEMDQGLGQSPDEDTTQTLFQTDWVELDEADFNDEQE